MEWKVELPFCGALLGIQNSVWTATRSGPIQTPTSLFSFLCSSASQLTSEYPYPVVYKYRPLSTYFPTAIHLLPTLHPHAIPSHTTPSLPSSSTCCSWGRLVCPRESTVAHDEDDVVSGRGRCSIDRIGHCLTDIVYVIYNNITQPLLNTSYIKAQHALLQNLRSTTTLTSST